MNLSLVSKYFDYNATTPISDEVAEIMKSNLDLFANPSGINRHSTTNKLLLQNYRESVARLLKTEPVKIFFTSGGSEANNWAIKGSLNQLKNTPGHIITTAIEHSSVLETIKYLSEQFSFEVSVIPPINVEEIGVDFLSFSGHKFYAPKGIGGLYIKNPKCIEPLIHGGGQEMTLRSGTESLVAISGLAQAAADADANIDKWDQHCWSCKKFLLGLLNHSHVPFKLNGSMEYEHAISNTINLAIPGIRAEALAVLMEKKYDFIISLGSACSNNKTNRLSHVLQAMHLTEQEIQSSIRISFGRFTTFESIRSFVNALGSCVDQLLKVSYKPNPQEYT